MNNKLILITVATISFIAVGVLLSHVRISIAADSLVGYATVLMTAGVAVTDYRLNSRRSLSK